MVRVKFTLASLANGWVVILRIIAGVYWLYFGSQKWFSYAWVRGVLAEGIQNNPIAIYSDFLRVFVLPNWEPITILQTIGETFAGLGLILGLLGRLSGIIGVIMSINLIFALGFSSDFAVIFWYYALGAILNVTVLLTDSSRVFGLDRLLLKRVGNSRILTFFM